MLQTHLGQSIFLQPDGVPSTFFNCFRFTQAFIGSNPEALKMHWRESFDWELFIVFLSLFHLKNLRSRVCQVIFMDVYGFFGILPAKATGTEVYLWFTCVCLGHHFGNILRFNFPTTLSRSKFRNRYRFPWGSGNSSKNDMPGELANHARSSWDVHSLRWDFLGQKRDRLLQVWPPPSVKVTVIAHWHSNHGVSSITTATTLL